MTFGEVLQRERLKAGLTQTQLAEKSGVPIGTIRDYEQARRDPQLSTARKLALAIGISLDVLSDTEEPDEEPSKPRGRPRKAEEPAVEEPPAGKSKKRTRKKEG